MPRIPDYHGGVSAQSDIPQRGAQPSDLGGTGFSELGQGLQQAGSRVAEAQRFYNQRKAAHEVTRTDIAMLRAQTDLSLELQDMAKNWKPEDGELVPAMQEKVRERMESLAFDGDTAVHDTVVGRQHYEKKAAELSSHFLLAATKAQSEVMGRQVVIEHNQAVDQAANTLQQNPDAFDVYQQQFSEMVDNPNGRYAAIPAQQREEIKRSAMQALAKSTVQGKIRQAPRVALNDLNAGWMGEHLKDTDTPVLINQAQTAVHALEIDEDRAYREQERQRVATARAISNKLLTKLAAHDADPTNPPLTAQDLIDSGLGQYDDNGFQSLISVLHTWSKEGAQQVKTDPTTFRDLFNRIHAAPDDPRRLKDEMAIQNAFGKQGKLSFADMTHLRKEFQESRTPEGARLSDTKRIFFDGIKTQITKSNLLLGKLDPDGDFQLMQYQLMVNRKIEAYRKEGKDPHDLFDPESKDFVGAPKVISRYQKTMQQSIKDFSQKMRAEKNKLPEIPKEHMRRDGESYADWKKRVNP